MCTADPPGFGLALGGPDGSSFYGEEFVVIFDDELFPISGAGRPRA